MANVSRFDVIKSAYHADISPFNYVDFCNGVPVGMPVVDTTGVDTLMPINPVTGHRDGVLARLFDPTVSVKDKELIMSSLQEIKSSDSRQGLTDDDLMMMIPSRYISDPVEIEHYMQDLRNYRDGLLSSKEDVELEPGPEPTPVPTPSPTE